MSTIRFGRRFVAAFAAAFVALTVVLGAGAAFAYWTATVNATGSVATPKVSISQNGFPALSTEYLNHTIGTVPSSTLRSAGSFTITNTGGLGGTATLTITGTGALTGMSVTAWAIATGTCAANPPASGAVTGTWGSTSLAGIPLGTGASATVCVVTTADRASVGVAGGTASVTGTAAVSLDAQGWIASAQTAVATQKTKAIYPLSGDAVPATGSRWAMLTPATNTARCLDVWDGSQLVDKSVSSFRCMETSAAKVTNPNRLWQMIPDTADRTLVSLRPAHAPQLRLGLAGGTGNQLATAAANASDPAQKWFVQTRGDGTHLFVNARTGMCMAPSPSADDVVGVVPCDSANVGIRVSAPVGPTISRVLSSTMKIDVNFYRVNMNGVKYSARIASGGGSMSCGTMGLDVYNPALTDTIRTITCTGVPTGTYPIEVYAVSDPTQVIYRFTATVTGSAMTLISVDS